MTRTYTYGLLPPTANARLVADQMRQGHDYRNSLIKIEQARRAAVGEILARTVDEEIQVRLAAFVQARDLARAEITQLRATARHRVKAPEQQARILTATAQITETRAEMRRRRTPSESARVGIAWAGLMAYSQIRKLRRESDVYWGTYLLHEQAMRASAASSSAAPRPLPWHGEGRVSVQLQGGIDPMELATDSQLQILSGRILAPGAARSTSNAVPLHGNGRRVGKGARSHRTLRLRVASDRRVPVWAEWPMQMHRDLPSGSRVKVATVSLRRRGTRWDWSVQITVDEGVDRGRPSLPPAGTVALNLGYARRPEDCLRAGYLVGSDGQERELLVLADVADALDKASAIRSQRDRDQDAMRTRLAAWISTQEDAPDWFRERTRYLANWRAPGRFAVLAKDWQVGWWDAGAAGYDLLEAWRLRDLHLERYETGLRSTALRRRRERYRILAREIADRYRTLVVDDTDLRVFQRIEPPESDEATPTALRRQKNMAAPHELRAALLDAFSAEHTKRRSAVNVTRVHATCGTQNEPCMDSRELTCGGCGVRYDQDANACQNLLREQQRADEHGETPRVSRSSKKRGYRIRKHQAEALDRQEEEDARDA